MATSDFLFEVEYGLSGLCQVPEMRASGVYASANGRLSVV
jgi:hypothetical protein